MKHILQAMIATTCLGFGVGIGPQSSAMAETHPVVVELYTSQGCSSCPPADAMLHDLAARDDVIALALHVDYWDYIGWADIFASPLNTQRQYAYAHAAEQSVVYTPQMVVAGKELIVGTKPMEIAQQIMNHASQDYGVSLTLTRTNNRVQITAASEETLPNGAVVQIVRFIPQQTVEIQRGENAGETLSYANIVTSWTAVGEWGGAADWQRRVRVDGDQGVAVIVQEPGPGRILAAQILR
ncbi:DUF1223 domain-containing protein [Aestuariibius sp. HNIBRBA575]|uniref:DUF1223 domain-containing protein n=1 Tax=Aestuariibius sp. HNIBRBA575 TaxID=3233343 RepID=UPI0034A3EA4F